MKNILTYLAFLFLMAAPAAGQTISEKVCQAIFDQADKILSPTHVYRRDVYNDDCQYEYDSKKKNLWVGVELYKSKVEAKKEFDSYLKLIPEEGDQLIKLTGRYWDHATFVKTRRPSNSSSVILQKGSYLIEIMSHDHAEMLQLEKQLRGIKLE